MDILYLWRWGNISASLRRYYETRTTNERRLPDLAVAARCLSDRKTTKLSIGRFPGLTSQQRFLVDGLDWLPGR
jgi:hypothetical protein